MRRTGREPSSTPAKAIEKITGLEPSSEQAEQRLANAVHWAYGTSWGLARAGLGAVGLRGLAASGAFFGMVWGAAALMLPALGLAPPVWQWSKKEIAKDALFHATYAFGASAAFRLLDGASMRGAEAT
jgi:hypothetical protein